MGGIVWAKEVAVEQAVAVVLVRRWVQLNYSKEQRLVMKRTLKVDVTWTWTPET